MRQPYTYTLPEQFINDPAVPLHWKLYTIINGFWISGKPVFASNAFFAEKLKCSERYIQMCFEKLEEMGLLERIGKSQNRTIVPKGANQQFVEGRTASSVRDELAVHHISDSISDSKVTAVADFELTVEPYKDDEDVFEPNPKREKAEKRLKVAYDAMISWAEEERGFPFLKTARLKQYSAFKIAKENGLKAAQLKERWLEMANEKFWQNNGFDWMNVVTSFNKKA